jgi:hypothetical protein
VGYLVKASGSYNNGFLFMITALVIGAGCFAALQSRVNRTEPETDEAPGVMQQNV